MSGKKYTLYYFPSRGRAEIARLLFAAAGVKYEDKRLAGDEWQKFKPNTPTGQMPILEVDGKMLPQSGTIARYLAKEFGLAGKDNWEQALVECVADTADDLATEALKFFFEKDEEKKKELQVKFMEEVVPRIFGVLEKMMDAHGSSGYFVGSSLTLADLSVYNILAMMQEALAKSQKLTDHSKKIGELPKIKEWVVKRPETQY